MESIEIICINANNILALGVERGSIQNSGGETIAFQPLSAPMCEHPCKGFAGYGLDNGFEQEQPFIPLISSGVLVVHLKLVSALDCKGIIHSADGGINNILHIVPLSADSISYQYVLGIRLIALL
jgi:hypothetical protein